MRVGDEVRVKITKRINEHKAYVELIDTGENATLTIKGQLRVLRDGTVCAWVLRYNKDNGHILLGNAYFGKYDISPNLTKKYRGILNKILNSPEEIIDEDISVLKGVVNRCIKRDQWDWYTTYKYLGYPSHQIMSQFVRESVEVRDALRRNERDSLYRFKEKHSFLLQSLAMHLDEGVLPLVQDCKTTIEPLGQELWERLSYDSKNNILIAERIAGSASKYILMHYLVTIEQEIFAHYIEPFINSKGRKISTECRNQYVKKSHDILTGKTNFSLGSIFYLGKNIENPRALKDSVALKEFHDYLGIRREPFIEICSLIGSQSICGLRITELRNGLAHGNAEITSRIGSEAYGEMHRFLLDPPTFLLKRVLENSLNYDKAPS